MGNKYWWQIKELSIYSLEVYYCDIQYTYCTVLILNELSARIIIPVVHCETWRARQMHALSRGGPQSNSSSGGSPAPSVEALQEWINIKLINKRK